MKLSSISIVWVARILVCIELVSITRAFALVNLIEAALIILFASSRELRARFVGTLSDLRVVMVLLFWFWIGIACLWGDAALSERFAEVWSWRKLLLVPFCFAIFEDEKGKKTLIYTLIGCASLLMIYSWCGFFEFIEIERGSQQVVENHATQGIFFAASGLILGWYIFFEKPGRLGTIFSLLLIIGLFGNTVAVATGRSGYLFLMVGSLLFVFFILVSGKRFWFLISIFALGLLFLGVSEKPYERFSLAVSELASANDVTASYSSLGMRFTMWTNTVDLVKEAPILGTGSGSFSGGYQKVVESRPDYDPGNWRSQVIDDPHQQFLLIWAEQGFVGLALFLAVLVCFGLPVKVESSKNQRLYYLIALTMLLGTFANGFANGHFGSFVEGRLFWIMAASMLAGTELRALKFNHRVFG